MACGWPCAASLTVLLCADNKRVADGVAWSEVLYEATTEARRALHARHCDTAVWARAVELFGEACRARTKPESKTIEELVYVRVPPFDLACLECAMALCLPVLFSLSTVVCLLIAAELCAWLRTWRLHRGQCLAALVLQAAALRAHSTI